MSVVRCEAEQEHVRGSRSGRFAFCISVRVSYGESGGKRRREKEREENTACCNTKDEAKRNKPCPGTKIHLRQCVLSRSENLSQFRGRA